MSAALDAVAVRDPVLVPFTASDWNIASMSGPAPVLFSLLTTWTGKPGTVTNVALEPSPKFITSSELALCVVIAGAVTVVVPGVVQVHCSAPAPVWSGVLVLMFLYVVMPPELKKLAAGPPCVNVQV